MSFKEKYNQNKTRYNVAAIVVVVLLLLLVPHIYRSYQEHRAIAAVNKIYNAKGKAALNSLSKSFTIKVDAKDKTIMLYPGEDIMDRINENIEDYYESHVSTWSRLTGEDDNYGTYGKMSVTDSTIQPMCYAISSSDSFVKHWKVNVYAGKGGSDELMYSYQDGHFTMKIEDGLDKLVDRGQEEHDENASEILKAAINAMNR